MAKKTKRKVSTVITPAPAPEVVEVTTVETPAPARVPYISRRPTSTTEFNPDYSYVKSDLKRIGVLASTFFIILIALSFIL